MTRTIHKRDSETGLILFSEVRPSPGGGLDVVFFFEGADIPAHLCPADPFDRSAALKGFGQIVKFLKDNTRS